jgi:hypothetical protein
MTFSPFYFLIKCVRLLSSILSDLLKIFKIRQVLHKVTSFFILTRKTTFLKYGSKI